MSDDPKKPEKPAPQAPDDESVPRQSGTDGNDPAVWDEATWNAAVWAGDSGTQPAHLPEGDPPPPRTLGAPHLASTSRLYPPTIRIEPLSAETRFAQLQARVDALEKLIAAPPPIGPGHNNPPEAIDAEPLLPSRDEIAAVIVIIRMLDPAKIGEQHGCGTHIPSPKEGSRIMWDYKGLQQHPHVKRTRTEEIRKP